MFIHMRNIYKYRYVGEWVDRWVERVRYGYYYYDDYIMIVTEDSLVCLKIKAKNEFS